MLEPLHLQEQMRHGQLVRIVIWLQLNLVKLVPLLLQSVVFLVVLLAELVVLHLRR